LDFAAFGIFILACGTTHVMSAERCGIRFTGWRNGQGHHCDRIHRQPFVLLIPMLPKLIALPSPSDCHASTMISTPILERRAAEKADSRGE
jgi:hypothetical protein